MSRKNRTSNFTPSHDSDYSDDFDARNDSDYSGYSSKRYSCFNLIVSVKYLSFFN